MADNYWHGRLHIFVPSAEGLKDADAIGKSDPFCVVRVLDGDKEIIQFKTNVIDDDLNPKWNEDFIAKLSGVANLRLYFEVWDEDTVGADFLGCATVVLKPNDEKLTKVQVLKLIPRPGQGDEGIIGTLSVKISLLDYVPKVKLEHDSVYNHPNGQPSKIVMGPVLVFRGLYDGKWTVGAIVVVEGSGGENPQLSISPAPTEPVTITKLVSDDTRTVFVYDFAIKRTTETQTVSYTINDKKNSFCVPAELEPLRMTACSCNGFHEDESKSVLKNHEYFMWGLMNTKNKSDRYHLLLQGGDQVYADRLWGKIEELKAAALSAGDEKALTMTVTDAMRKSFATFYMDLYVDCWNKEFISTGLASIPSIMMWDDHDIFDGWGSYPDNLLACPLYKEIFKAAETYYCAMQLGCTPDKLPRATLRGTHRGKTQVFDLGSTGILAIDLRTERSKTQVMHDDTYNCLEAWFSVPRPNLKQLIVISSIPAIYNDFSSLETLISGRGFEVEDDLLDHWRAEGHSKERLVLFKKLFGFAEKNNTRVTLISGDVHIGALGVLIDKKLIAKSNVGAINSLITSAIVNAPPGPTLVSLLETNATTVEKIDKPGMNYRAALVKFPPKREQIYIGQRNFLELIGTTSFGFICNWLTETIVQQYTFYINPPTAGLASDLIIPLS